MKYAAIYQASSQQVHVKNIAHRPNLGEVVRIPDGSERYARVVAVCRMTDTQMISTTFRNAAEAMNA